MISSSPSRVRNLRGLVAILLGSVGCSSSNTTDLQGRNDGGSPSRDAGATDSHTADSHTTDSHTTDSHAADSGPTIDGATPLDGGVDTGTAADVGVPDTGLTDSSAPMDGGGDSGAVTSTDGFGVARTACINKINALRATDTAIALMPYTLENTDTINTCTDTQASTDESKDIQHWSFTNNDPTCISGTGGQAECPSGWGTTPTGIEGCLQQMWDESLMPGCTGCIGCAAFGGQCPNCGLGCYDYVNLSAPYLTTAACGFGGAAPSSTDGWTVVNFQ